MQPARGAAPPPTPPRAGSGGGRGFGRGPWRIAVALVGVAAIAVGIVEIVTHAKSRAPTKTHAPLGKAAFIRRADAICRRLNPEIDAEYRIALADSNSGDVVGADAAIAKVVSAAGSLLDRLRALGPPAQDAGAVATLLAEYGQLVDDAVAGTPESNASAVALQSQIAAQAAQFGFHVCGVT